MRNARGKVPIENSKILRFSACFWSLAFILSGCAGFQAAGEIQGGRNDLIAGRAESALPRFQRAVAIIPNYIMDFGTFREGAWTYIGRAYYDMGKLPEAHQALERALSLDKEDNLARLYLGLTLAREGDRAQGLSEMQSALRDIHDWLDWIEVHTSYGIYWDPLRQIRNEIKNDLAAIASKEFDWQKLIDSGETLGKKMEEEIDLARRDEIESYKQGEGRDR